VKKTTRERQAEAVAELAAKGLEPAGVLHYDGDVEAEIVGKTFVSPRHGYIGCVAASFDGKVTTAHFSKLAVA